MRTIPTDDDQKELLKVGEGVGFGWCRLGLWLKRKR